MLSNFIHTILKPIVMLINIATLPRRGLYVESWNSTWIMVSCKIDDWRTSLEVIENSQKDLHATKN